MMGGLFIMSCAGALLVILNKPIARGFRWINLELGYEDYGLWPYRLIPIIFGALLLLRSLFPD